MDVANSSVGEKHNAIEKALAILGLFAFKNQELGTIEVSKALGYHKATTSRTLILLADQGFLEQNEKSKKYHLGRKIVSLGNAVTRTLKQDLVQIAKPYLEALRNEIQETIVLEVLSGNQMVTAYIAESPSMMQLGGRLGEPMPSAVTAGSKAILAYSSLDELDRFLENGLPHETPNSITDRATFIEHLKEVKQTGMAIDIGENDLDMNAISAPIFNIEGRPVASVDAIGIANKIDIDLNSSTAQAVKRTASDISKRLYYSPADAHSLDEWLAALKPTI